MLQVAMTQDLSHLNSPDYGPQFMVTNLVCFSLNIAQDTFMDDAMTIDF